MISLQLYLAVTPDRLNDAKQYTSYLAHVAYRIGDDGALYAQALLPSLRGGLQVLGDSEALLHSPDTLCREILRHCIARSFSGILLDFVRPANAQRIVLVQKLARLAKQYGRRLYVPEQYAETQHTTVLICTALSGGSLRQRLEQAAAQYGAERIALDLQRLAMDFTLPAPGGDGTALSVPELQRRMAGHATYFSEELCAHYFTYRQNGNTHFVLFDDASTLQRKAELAQQLGIGEGFLMFPEVEDLLPQLFRTEQKERS